MFNRVLEEENYDTVKMVARFFPKEIVSQMIIAKPFEKEQLETLWSLGAFGIYVSRFAIVNALLRHPYESEWRKDFVKAMLTPLNSVYKEWQGILDFGVV